MYARARLEALVAPDRRLPRGVGREAGEEQDGDLPCCFSENNYVRLF